MARMRPPIVPEDPPDVLTDDELRRLMKTCEPGKTFEDRRDAALIRLFFDTGFRRAEVAALRYTPNAPETNDVDLDQGLVTVMGKGRRQRTVPISTKTIKALDRYVRARASRSYAHLPALWLARKGALTESGISQALKERGKLAGLPGLHPHQLRHTFAHAWLSAGEGENALMQLAGWRSRAMIDRYGAKAAADRAVAAHRRARPGDRV